MSDYWNNLSRLLGANPNHLREEFTKQMGAIATPAAVDYYANVKPEDREPPCEVSLADDIPDCLNPYEVG